MNKKELREQVADKISSEFGDGEPNLVFADELITLIRNATLDEVKEVVKSCERIEYGHTLTDAIKAIDNLRGNSDK